MGLLAAMPAAGPPVYSWSTVDAAALVLGRLAVDPAIDRAVAEAEGVTVVRRSSGGGPVLWDRDLLGLDVAVPRDHALAGRDVVNAYRWLGEAIADALRSLGLPDVEVVSVAAARAARARAGPAADACFGGLSPFEVLAGGRKVVGLSQARRAAGALLQAGIALRLDAARLARLMGRDAAFADGLSATAAGLADAVPEIAADDVVRAVDRAVCAQQGVWLRDDEPGAGERAAIAAAVGAGRTGD